MHVCVLAEEQLQSNPGTLGLSALKPAIEWVNLSRVEVNLLKNRIEIGLAVCTLPLVFLGQVALIFPILFFNYIRIKYVSNFFLKYLFKHLNLWMKENLPAGVYEFTLFVWLRNYLESFVVFDNGKPKPKEESFQDQDARQGVQGNQKPAHRPDGQGASRVQGREADTDALGEDQHYSERIFADMIASNFKYPKGFEPTSGEYPDLDEMMDDGADVEEVSADDLD